MNEIQKQVEGVYAVINALNTYGRTLLIDLAYPSHDAVQDPDAVADLMMLRDSLNSLSKVCRHCVDNLTAVIDLKPEHIPNEQH